MKNHRRLGLAVVVCVFATGVAGAAALEQSSPASPPATPLEAQVPEQNVLSRSAVEFADLAHYARANAALPPPQRDERRVVFIGDSITEFWADTEPGYFAGTGRIDRGISGQTTPQMLLRFRQDVISLKPAVVHILAGTNDIAANAGPMELEETEANIASMVDLALAHGIRVVVGSVLPATDFWWYRGLNPGPRIVALNAWLKAYARSRRLVYVDYYAAMTDGALGIQPALAPDGVHPSAQGYRVMAPLAEAGIAAALRRPIRSSCALPPCHARGVTLEGCEPAPGATAE
jgi:lysophospholipase L1-like esterase